MWILVSAQAILICVLIYYLVSIKRRIKETIEILKEKKDEKSRQHFLINTEDDIAEMQELLNDIFYDFEKQLEEFAISIKTNQQLMTSLAHDVRTPMTTLMGYLDVIASGQNNEKRDTYIRLATDKAYDLKVYIDSLFEWFRLNSNEEVIDMKRTDVIEATRRVIGDWIPVLEEAGMEYEVELPEGEAIIMLDSYCYSRIINNFMQNVLKHSHAKSVTIYGRKSETRFELEIKDNGIGIADDNLKYVFERLYKCDENRSEKGNGLGLNIVKMLAEKMGGNVSALSEYGKWTSFIVSFPLQKKQG